MTLMEKEIYIQTQALKDCNDINVSTLASIAKAVKDNNIKNIVVSARGSSDNASNYFKYICEIYAGIPVGFASPSVVTLYDGKIDYSGTLVIGVSQSGKAADVLAVLEKAKSQNAITVAVTNNVSSPMAMSAKFHLNLNCGEELSVAATKTFTAQLYVLGLLAAELAQNKSLKKNLETVPSLIKYFLECKAEVDKSAIRLKSANDCYVLARGTLSAAAQETALKIQETTYVKAKAYAVSDFHHGPFAVIDNSTRAIVFAPSGPTAKDALEMVEKIKASGCDITVFSDEQSYSKIADSFVSRPKAEDSVSPFVYVVAAQLFAL